MTLINFCASLAVDPALFARFHADPAGVAAEKGLADSDRDVLLSGDKVLISGHFSSTSPFPDMFNAAEITVEPPSV